MRTKFNIKIISIIGFMAALCYVATYISIPITLPFGKTMIHFGNIFMLVSGLVFGKVVGGLSGAIGMSLFDVFSGTFLIYAPGTFIIKFLSGYFCGKLARMDKFTEKKKFFIAAFLGICINIIMSPINSIIVKMFTNNFEIWPLIVSAFGDLAASILNGIIAVLLAIPISNIIRKAVNKTSIQV